MVKDPKKVAQGKKAKAAGSDFELRVRKDMTEKGWVVDKFGNNVDLDNNCLIIAKNKWAGPNRPMMMGAGFCDFVCFKLISRVVERHGGEILVDKHYNVIGIECKCNGELSKIEKEKCRWLLDNNVFSKILIAEKTKPKNRIVIVYHDFTKCYGK